MNTAIFEPLGSPPSGSFAAGSEAEPVLEVNVERDGEPARVVRVAANQPVVIGRDAACTICLEDQHVSRRHLVLTAFEHFLRVEDTSSNGTLAGERLLRREASEVPFGTPILAGAHTLTVAIASRTPSVTDRAPFALPTVARSEPPAIVAEDADATASLRREIHKRLLSHLDLANLESNRLDDPSFRPQPPRH